MIPAGLAAARRAASRLRPPPSLCPLAPPRQARPRLGSSGRSLSSMALTPDYTARAQEAEAGLRALEANVQQLQAAAERGEIERLKKENAELSAQIEAAKAQLVAAEAARGRGQIALPGQPGYTAPSATPKRADTKPSGDAGPATATPADTAAPQAAKKAKKKKNKGGDGGGKAKAAPEAAPVDVSRLQFVVGKIEEVSLHPDAEKLYVEKINAGEGENRTIISGLVEHIPIEEMQGRMVMILANLKPRKMRGIASQGMVMCTKLGDKIEVLAPPPGAEPGDKVGCAGYDGSPDAVLNPKKKIWETVQPDLKTNEQCVATYKGVELTVQGKGAVKSASHAGAQIS